MPPGVTLIKDRVPLLTYIGSSHVTHTRVQSSAGSSAWYFENGFIMIGRMSRENRMKAVAGLREAED